MRTRPLERPVAPAPTKRRSSTTGRSPRSESWKARTAPRAPPPRRLGWARGELERKIPGERVLPAADLAVRAGGRRITDDNGAVVSGHGVDEPLAGADAVGAHPEGGRAG